MNIAAGIVSLWVRKWTAPSLVIVETRFMRIWGSRTSIHAGCPVRE
jgi:hypothetical protein